MEAKKDKSTATRKNRNICIPLLHEEYESIISDPFEFRKSIDRNIADFPELFPPEISSGYTMKDIYRSRKSDIQIRRIEIGGVSYSIRPSFAAPYLAGLTDDIEPALFLIKFNVPFWALSHVFGKNPMYWYRLEKSIGRNSIVGTTVRKPEDIPVHLAADEKHTLISGKKAYIATTVGGGCILGADVAEDAGEQSLKNAYCIYKDEALHMNPEYSPVTVNTDGWKAARNAWQNIFPAVALICCFLHVFIKIRDRAQKKYRNFFASVTSKLWNCYRAETRGSFSQRIRRLAEWCKKNDAPSVISDPVIKLRENIASYHVAYKHPQAHRTSNMADRLIQRMDRHLFSTQYFHGSMDAAGLSIRGWALIHNFAPCNPRTIRLFNGFKSPAERLNKFHYHENWLHNLFVSASLRGYRRPPLNPL